MGAATLLMAAAQSPAIRAVVSDSAYADIIPILEREVPKRGHLPLEDPSRPVFFTVWTFTPFVP